MTSLQDQVTSLLSLSIAEPKTRGLPSSDIESAAIFESIAANLLLYPRTILYVAHLARQGLQAAVTAELAQLAIVLEDVIATGNTTYAITDTSDLGSAQTALILLQNQKKISTVSNQFSRFDSAISSFLSGQLAKNVRTPGSTGLTTPSADAISAISGDYASLTSLHATTLALLYALGVGVQNFVDAPLSSAIGTAAAARVYNDIQDIIDSIAADPSGVGSSDFTNRLIADRATLKALGSPVSYSSPKIDTGSSLPVGYSLQAISGEAPAVASSGNGPFGSFTDADDITLALGGGSPSTGNSTNFLQSVSGSVCNPALEGSPVSYPVTIPPNSYLFLTLTALSSITGWTQASDGTWTQASVGGGWTQNTNSSGTTYSQTFVVGLNSGSTPVSLSQTQVELAIEAATGGFSSDPTTGTPFTAVSFVTSGSGQILIYADGTKYQSIRVDSSCGQPSSATSGQLQYFTNSSAALVGFQIGQTGIVGSVPVKQLVDAFNLQFGSLVKATLVSNGANVSIGLETVSIVPGTYLTIGGAWATILGLSGTFYAKSSSVTLQGSVLGVPTNPVNPIGLVDVGDTIVLPTGTSSIASVSAIGVTLSTPLNTFALGDVTVTSALYLAWEVLNSNVQAQVQFWLSSGFGAGMGQIDLAISALIGNPTPGTINAAKTLLGQLQTQLTALGTSLADPSSLLPPGSASEEISNSNGIVQTLIERNYDKALDMYESCQVVQMLQMDYQTASYGGAFMTAAQAVSQNDINYPNAALDEGMEANASPDRPANQ